jgi:phosphatidylserine/phosphatidylglycerophosphate/cardiolipin synthase-like enzyme
VPSRKGNAHVQIQRTIHRDRYRNGQAAPGGSPFDIEAGEQSNFAQYCAAIAAARRSIYIEHQHVDVPAIIDCLRQALQRDVEIVAVVPAAGKPSEELTALGAFETFTLAGIAGLANDGQRKPVWVHAKLMIVDDVWVTVGSCNLHHASLFGNAELNVACWHPDTARTLRIELLQEHLDHDTSNMDDRTALRFFRKIAMENRRRFDAGENAWQGLAFSLVPAIKFVTGGASANEQMKSQ